MEVVEVDPLEVVAYAKEHGNSAAAANFGYIEPASVKKWRKKEAVYERELAALRKKAEEKKKKGPGVPKELSPQERDEAYQAILKRLKEDTDNVWPFLDPVPNDVKFYYDDIQSPICLAD
ncbi:hypothetical protein AAVH_33754, partial [Aphelenchoides avenae]